MAGNIQISGFRGMANVDTAVKAAVADQAGMASPRVILNADVRPNGSLVPRTGYTKKVSLTKPHSLYAGSLLLCVYQGTGGVQTLAKISPSGGYTDITEIDGPKSELYYAETDGAVYMSNKYWSGVLDPVSLEVRDWGITPPGQAPRVLLIEGDFPPGAYRFTYTAVDSSGRMSGNSPISGLQIMGGDRGFRLVSPPANAILWLSDTNTGKLYYAGWASQGDFTSPALSPMELPAFNVIRPPKLTHLLHFSGRMWGVVGKKLHYSMPLAHEWFRAIDFIPFPDTIAMVAEIKEGLFVHTENERTFILEGTSPSEMKLREIASHDGEGGVIPGTLLYRDVQESGQELPTWRHKTELPVWVSRSKGVCAGTQHGRLVSLSEERIQWDAYGKGAALARTVNGEQQMIFTMPVAPIFSDSLVKTAFEEGSLL